jgi:hypothetical protein
MYQILAPIPILLMFAVFFAVIGYRFFSVYWEKVWLGILIIPLFAMPAYYSRKGLYDHFWPGMWAQFVWISCCYAMSKIHVRIRRHSIMKLQESRDREGAALSDSLNRSAEKSQNFALYLRPFKVTDNVPTSLPGFLDFEGLLEDALRDTIPLFALGHPMETYGAGRILTDDASWQKKIIPMMEEAQTIFIIPSDRPGTLWEIEHIFQNNLIEKCVFIMPPTGATKWTKKPEENWEYDKALIDQSRDWVDAARALEAVKIHLPRYEQSGGLFTISPDGELNKYWQMPLLLPKFTGASSYLETIRESIGELRDNSIARSGTRQHKDITPEAGLFANEEKEYDITSDGFEVKMSVRTWRGWVGWLLIGAVLLILIILSWHHWTLKAMFLLGLESAVASTLLSIPLKIIGFDADFRDE